MRTFRETAIIGDNRLTAMDKYLQTIDYFHTKLAFLKGRLETNGFKNGLPNPSRSQTAHARKTYTEVWAQKYPRISKLQHCLCYGVIGLF